MARISELMNQGLAAADLVAAWLSRRVLPLQRRCHRICDMSGRRDPSRISTFQMDMDEFLHRMKMITTLKVDADFEFGLKAYNRRRPPPVVCCLPRPLASCIYAFFACSDPIYSIGICRLPAYA